MTIDEFTKIVGENSRMPYSLTISFAKENYGKELCLLEETDGEWKIKDMKKPSDLDYETGLRYFMSMVKMSEVKRLPPGKFEKLLKMMAKDYNK